MAGMTDRDLWQRAGQGDAEAYGVLFDRHARTVYNYCFRRTADWALAEDLTSVVFLEAWRRRAEVTPESDSILPWLLGVAANLLRNTRRGLRRYREALARIPHPIADLDPADDIASRLDDEERMRQTLANIERLSVDEQEVLSLCVWTGLSYEDAAVALGVPVGTVRSRLHRAEGAPSGTRPRLRTRRGRRGALTRRALKEGNHHD